ncbi:MAG: hypothetical protein OXN25_11270 [Candidatus Poribacteria bacterium]|nr:hypothetical protein [Candidatus Poribacteria bacterium]
MKHCLSVLRDGHRSLLAGSSYSTVCACVVSLIFLFLAMSCGPPPQGQYHVPESAIQAAERNVPEQAKQSTGGSLPESAMVHLERLPYLRNAFKGPPPPANRSGLDDFYARTRATVQHAAVLSDGSLDILKAFIAKGWAPIVMIRLQGRNTEILPISRYNDQSSEIFLQNPVNLGERRISYADFEKSWAMDSRNKCVLITPQQLTEVDIQKVLGRYLPAEAFQEMRLLRSR